MSGWITGLCPRVRGCRVHAAPVTIPVNIMSCDGTVTRSHPTHPEPWDKFTVYKVPLCGNSPGNVGWIDWYPPAGGASEIADAIDHPNNPPIDLPSWQLRRPGRQPELER